MIPLPEAPTTASSRSEVAPLIVFGIALLVSLRVLCVGWDSNLLGRYQFRQVQTAIPAAEMLRGGITLNYRTPLLGPPWEIPLEMPLYQIAAAGVARATGLALEPAGRLTSWLFFLTSLPAAYLLLGRFNLGRGQRLIFLSLLLLSPIYLFYSRQFLIESLAFAAGMWFLAAFSRAVDFRRPAWILPGILAGAISASVKVTTAATFLIAAALLLVAIWNGQRRSRGSGFSMPLAAGAVLILSTLAAGTAWTMHAKAIRDLNPEADFLRSVFGAWSFGTPATRFSLRFWWQILSVSVGSVASGAGLLILLLYGFWLGGRFRRAVAGSLVTYLLAPLVFANLYEVHDYYFYASAVFLLAAVGFCLVELGEHPRFKSWPGLAVSIAVLALQIEAFAAGYFHEQNEAIQPPPVAEMVSAATAPEDTIVVLGMDWDGALPYSARRRALMLRSGRERDPASVRASIERLPAHSVGAVVLLGPSPATLELVRQSMASLDLGDEPLFVDGGTVEIWVPRSRQRALYRRLDMHRHPPFQMNYAVAGPEAGTTLTARDIRRRPEFDCLDPRPVRAYAAHEFAPGKIFTKRVVIAHATSEFVFGLPAGATRLSAVCGLDDNSYRNGNRTDGIGVEVSLAPPAGAGQVLYSRVLDPANKPADRGPQSIDVPMPRNASGELVIRILPGPRNDASFDWSYLGELSIR